MQALTGRLMQSEAARRVGRATHGKVNRERDLSRCGPPPPDLTQPAVGRRRAIESQIYVVASLFSCDGSVILTPVYSIGNVMENNPGKLNA